MKRALKIALLLIISQNGFAQMVNSDGMACLTEPFATLSNDNIEIFYNPYTNFVVVDGVFTNWTIEILDANNNVVSDLSSSSSPLIIDLCTLGAGSFFIKFENQGNQICSEFPLDTNCSLQTSSLVSIDNRGNLCYTPDAMGNVIPDFSMVGYHQGWSEIPNVPVVVTLTPSSGDRYTVLQNAIDAVATLVPDANGHRGTILLTAGYYEVSQTLRIRDSGIVIRGEGKDASGTIIEYTATNQSNLFEIGGTSNIFRDGSTAKLVVDTYVPIGAKSMTVESGHTFQVGDRVAFSLTTNSAWISLLGADQLEAICGAGHTNWSPGTIHFKRRVTGVDGDLITLDAPVVDPVDAAYNVATITKYNWSSKIEECGIENIRLESSFASNTDEDHGWTAIQFKNIENAWVNNVNGYYFGYSLVAALAGSYQVTIKNCGMFDYKSIVTGSRRYGFYSDDSDLILFKNCVSDKGRHDFVQGSRTPGPNVYTNCHATNSTNDVGPHHRWSTGTLWDRVSTNDAINVQNRECSGSGHGWAGAQQVFWNCTAPEIILHDPPAHTTNWAIGCIGNITNQGDWLTEPIGVVESANNPITAIPSLYEAQLKSRIGLAKSKELPLKK